jgi:hypothetical protein
VLAHFAVRRLWKRFKEIREQDVTNNFRLGSIPGYVAAVRQNAGKRAMIGETRVLANGGYSYPICQTLNQAQFQNHFQQ